MKNFVVTAYQFYFWIMSRIAPNLSANKAIKLIFTVNNNRAKYRKIPEPDSIERLSGGGYLYAWKGTSDKTILLIHGWNGSVDHFEVIITHLISQNCTVYGISPAGFGHSEQKHSHPGLFVEAIKQSVTLIPNQIDLAIGHSMGSGALGLAASQVTVANKLVFVSSPASFLNVIDRFAKAIKLSAAASKIFSNAVEVLVGSHSEFEVADKVDSLDVPCFVIHDKFDKQVPFDDALRLVNSLKLSTLLATENLGHTRILSNTFVCKKILSLL